MSKTLLIRADANPQMGTGHVMRCLALAQAWQDAGGSVTVLTTLEVSGLEARLHAEGINVVQLPNPPGTADDARDLVGLARRLGAQWIVVDGYHFGADYQQTVKEGGLQLLVIDDHGRAGCYYADIVVNQNLHADEAWYANRQSYTHLLLGTRYALLRREFVRWRGWRREIPEVASRVLVTMGGADPDNVTLKVITALQGLSMNGLEAVVTVGAGNRHDEALQSAVRGSHIPIHLEHATTNMPDLMAWADMAVSGGGTTTWELGFMGLPAIVVSLVDHQIPITESLAEGGIASNAGWYAALSEHGLATRLAELLNDSHARQLMSEQGKSAVDGEGSQRVVEQLRSLSGLLSSKN